LQIFAREALKELGQLEPLTDGMVIKSLQGVVKKLGLLENLVEAIDQGGSRRWNDSNGKE
jgi:hypothetical protein